jgi:arylsulfatase A-like enzyme
MNQAWNLVVVCIDTLRADLLDDPRIQVPHLRRCVLEGVRFGRAFGEAQPTIQSRRTFFTGRRSFPWRFAFDTKGLGGTGQTGWHKIPPEQPTLAERLAERGYATGLVADTYHMFKPTMNFTRGFLSWDFLRGQESDPYGAGRLAEETLARHLPTHGPVDRRRHAVLHQYLLNQRHRRSEEDWQAPRVFRKAARWLEDNVDNQPFFLWVDSFDPHEPWDPAAGYADAYYCNPAVKDYIFPQNFAGISEEEIARTRALYYGEVTMVDRWLGYFWERLQRLGLRETTLVAIVSDHGTELWDDGRFGKSAEHLHPYNTQLNWIMMHPHGLGAGRRIDAFVQGHDLAPTLLAVLGVPHEPLDGLNAWDLVTGNREALRDQVVTGWGMRAAVRTREWNVCFDLTKSDGAPQAYDLVRDVQEKHDRAAEAPEVVAWARGALAAVAGGPLPFSPPQPVALSTVAPLQHWAAARFPSSAGGAG